MIAPMLLGLALVTAPAQTENLAGGSIRTLPEQAPNAVEDGWIGYSTHALPDKLDLCCWKSWHNGNPSGRGCRLGSANGHLQTGASGPSVRDPRRPDQLLVLGRVADGVLQDLLTVSQDCPVDLGGNELTWLGTWSNNRSASWLGAFLDPEARRLSGEIFRALAFHVEGDIEVRLSAQARAGDADLASDAIFWLGEARGEAGLAQLESLLEDLPPGQTRRQINFALGQNQSSAAAARLVMIAREDPSERQRADALFWMARSYPDSATPLLMETVSHAQSRRLLEAALQGLSELNTTQAVHSLQNIALTHQDFDVRGKAMFWLAQGHPSEALSLLTKLLDEELPKALMEPAVFALSQVPAPASTKALLELATNHSRPRAVRRQALFWLAQSDDPQAADALVSMLQEHDG